MAIVEAEARPLKAKARINCGLQTGLIAPFQFTTRSIMVICESWFLLCLAFCSFLKPSSLCDFSLRMAVLFSCLFLSSGRQK